jgi:hypothetical protein
MNEPETKLELLKRLRSSAIGYSMEAEKLKDKYAAKEAAFDEMTDLLESEIEREDALESATEEQEVAQ